MPLPATTTAPTKPDVDGRLFRPLLLLLLLVPLLLARARVAVRGSASFFSAPAYSPRQTCVHNKLPLLASVARISSWQDKTTCAARKVNKTTTLLWDDEKELPELCNSVSCSSRATRTGTN